MRPPELTIDPALADQRAALVGTARALLERFSPRTAAKGWSRRSCVGPLTVTADGCLEATVLGTDPTPYEVHVGLHDPDGSVCDCPVGDDGDCKHAWAVLERFLAAAGQPAQPQLRDPRAQAPWADRPARPAPERGEVLLARLDELLGALPSSGPDAPVDEGPARITWRVGVVARRLVLEPWEQRRRSDGGWTDGRKVAVRRLLDRSLAAHPEVAAVARCIEEHDGGTYYYGRDLSYELDVEAALVALVGSPRVTWLAAPTRPVSVQRGEVALRLAPDGGGVHLEPVVDDVALTPEVIARADETDPPSPLVVLQPEADRILVAGVEAVALPVLHHLACARTSIPVGPALGARLTQLERVAPLRPAAGLELPVVEADGQVRLWLVARAQGLEGGLRASLRVRPAQGGAASAPGEGKAEWLAWVAPGLTRVRRDLAAEARAAGAAAAALGLAGRTSAGASGAAAWTWELDLEGALALLDATRAPGHGVVVEWQDERRLVVSRPLELGDLRVKIDERRDWFDVDGTLEVDGERVALASVLEAMRGAGRFVTLEGGRLLRLTDALRARLEALRAAGHSRAGRLEVDAASAPAVREALAEVEVQVAASWRALLERFDSAQRVSTALPKGLEAELRPYQREGFAWLKRLATWGAGACLADDMGLGKTVQAIALLLDRGRRGPALVVAPTSVGDNWMRELARFAPGLRATLLRETDRAAGTLAGLGPRDVLVASYDLARIDAEALGAVEWATLVLDEAQRVKNAATKTAQALRDLKADWRLALTGTPIENRLSELWSLFRLVSPGLLGSWEAFRERYAAPIERDKDAAARDALARKVRPFVLRRTKGEVATDLPPRTDVRRDVELGEGERALYDDARLAAIAHLERLVEGQGEAGSRFHVLAALTRLRQLACHPGLVEQGWRQGSAKLEALLELATSLKEAGHRALVFSQFTTLLDLAAPALEAAGLRLVRLDGRTPARARQRAIDAFQGGQADLFLISLKAGGTGLNLTAADHVVHLDPWWNPAVEDQASDRAHRIGQTRPVTVHRLVATDTIEERILALHAEKRDLVASVLDGADRAGALSTTELLDLIRGGEPVRKRPTPAPREVTVEPAMDGPPAPDLAALPAGPAPTFDARAVRELRARLGLDPSALGAIVGVTAVAVRNWERGKNAPSSPFQHRLAALAARPSAAATRPPAPISAAPRPRTEPEFGPAEVRDLRERLGETRAGFARLLEVTPTTVGAWEEGRARPSGPHPDRLAALLADLEREPLDAAGIRAIRDSLGLTQAAFATLIHATQGSVSAWEQGRVRPDAIRAERLLELRARHARWTPTRGEPRASYEAEELLAIRERLGLSRSQFAELTGVSSALVARWEKGQSPCAGAHAGSVGRLDSSPPPALVAQARAADAAPSVKLRRG